MSKQVINDTPILELTSWHAIARTHLRALEHALTNDWMPDGVTFKANDKSLKELNEGLSALSFACLNLIIDQTNPSNLVSYFFF
jgi:hypothetical protein